MNSETSDACLAYEPVITVEGRFYRVNIVRGGKVESYLCESVVQAKKLAALLSKPPEAPAIHPTPTPTSTPRPHSSTQDELKLVRSRVPLWKVRP